MVQPWLLPKYNKNSLFLTSQLHFFVQKNSGEVGQVLAEKSQINLVNWPILVKPIEMGTPYCSQGFGDGGKPQGPHSRGWGMQTLQIIGAP